MGLTEDIADELAQEALRIMERTGDENLANSVAKVIGSSSTTMEEAFLTAVRVRRAEKRARELLARSQPKPAAQQPAAQAPAGSSVLNAPGASDGSTN